MRRAFLFVLDSFGIGHAPDADRFGDAGSDTLGHIAERCARGEADRPGLREGPLDLPHLTRLGLFHAADLAAGHKPAGTDVSGFFGSAQEISSGKDTPSGHWEMTGVPVTFDWGYFPDEGPAFSDELVAAIIAEGKVPGILGNCHASGTDIIARHGEEHIRTGKPICYTSADSVFQIAAHETHFGLDRLYRLCETAFELTAPLKIGRVIARPFVGETASEFKRTGNRRDFAIAPPEPTLLDRARNAGRQVYAIGKISDIYAGHGVTHKIKASGNMVLFDRTLEAMEMAADGAFIMTNFVDFDQEYGHRRDVPGYARALEEFDGRIPELIAALRPDDLVIFTSDHGNDPTWRGTDHTREQIPILAFSPALGSGTIGIRPTFADIGESIARWLGLAPGPHGTSFL